MRAKGEKEKEEETRQFRKERISSSIPAGFLNWQASKGDISNEKPL